MNAGVGSGRIRRALSLSVVATLFFSGTTATAAPPKNTWKLTGEQKVASAPVRPAPPAAAPAPVKHEPTPLPTPVWPAASESDVTMSAAPAQANRPDGPAVQAAAGGGPVHIGFAHAASARAATASVVPQADVRVADRTVPDALGLHGVVFSVTGGPAGTLHIGLDYGGFGSAFGGGWADRLHLVELPACALTTPAKAECRKQAPVAAPANDVKARQVTGDTAFTANSTHVFAATGSGSGSGGDTTAQPLSPAGSWQGGDGSGGFAYSYPITVPKAPGGAAPNLSLAYSSAGLDGMTSGTNNQGSQVGDGWDFTPGGYVERHYWTCSEDPATATSNAKEKTGDQCWGPDNATLVLGGHSTELIQVDATHWKPANDDGSTVERLVADPKNPYTSEYWKVTAADGTQYYLGLNHLPGWTPGQPETQSTWTVPVFGNNPEDPCYKAGDFAGSMCVQPWRWNLDYVVDPHGNAGSYYYQPEFNYYGLNKNITTPGVQYTAGGYALRMEYGLRLTEDTAGNPTVYGSAPTNRVVFTADFRCTATAGYDCKNPPTSDLGHAGNWPDTPVDEICTADKACLYGSPSFFTTHKLASIEAQYNNGGKFTDLDKWDLTQSFRPTGDALAEPMWLDGVQHTGYGTDGSAITLPPTTFQPQSYANRVDTVGDKYAPLKRNRLVEIDNETGGKTGIAYTSEVDTQPGGCVVGTVPKSPDTDTQRCFAAWWTPSGATDPILDWFRKYLVTDVTEYDNTGGSAPVVTHYDYLGDAAWHHDEGQFTPPKRQTWGQWRGYNVVRTTVGDPKLATTVTESLFMRGMDGDVLPGNGVRHASVTDSDGTALTDQDALAGFTRETREYLPGTTTVDTSSISDPWLKGPNATSADGTLKAYQVDVAATKGKALLADGRTYRRTQVNKTYDDNGHVTRLEDLGDLADATDDSCTKTTYAPGTNGITSLAQETVMFTGTCAGEQTAGNSVTDVQVSYDHHAFGDAPTAGDITEQDTLDTWDGTGKHFVPTSKVDYDALGRQTKSTDVYGHESATGFAASASGVVTGTTQKNPKGWVTGTTVDPRGNPTAEVDPNGVHTDITYDALGRKTAVWNPGRSKAAGDSPTAKFGYTESQTTPTTVVTSTLRDDGSYTDSYALFDGLGRARQTQTPAEGGGRVVADTLYDARGLAFKTNNSYFNADSGPSGTLVTIADANVPNQTVVQFDWRSRPTASIVYSKSAEQYRTTTLYEGADRTTTIPPPGGSPETVITDVAGQTKQLLQYSNGYTPGGANPADTTTYTYNGAGAETSRTDSAGNVWTTGYDLRGRRTSQSDPDNGTSTFGYDQGNQVTSTTDARGRKLFSSYDELGRRTQENADAPAPGGTKLATWTFDTLPNGLGLPAGSTRWVGADAYTERVAAYDGFGRPTSLAVDVPAAEGKLAGTYQFTTKYNPTGSVASTTSPAAGNVDAETIIHTYDGLGLPATTYAIDNKLGTTTPLASKTDYDSFNALSGLQLDGEKSATNVGMVQTYDQVTRRPQTTTVTRATQVNAELTKRTYSYDPAGNVTKIADTPSGGASDVQCFAYDYLQRTTDAWTPASDGQGCTVPRSTGELGGAAPYWQTYSYDKTGNRKQEVDHQPGGPVTSDYTYPDPGAGAVRPHAVRKVDVSGPTGTSSNTYGYFPDGSTQTRDVGGNAQAFEYDYEGHAISATDKSGTSTYVYDAGGNRLVTHDPTGATLTVGDLQLFQAAGTSGVTATRFYEHGGTKIAERVGSTGIKWMLSDLHGTDTLSITQGTLSATTRYSDPFGNPRGQTPGSWPDKHGFVGGQQQTTGLTQLGARDYDPAIGKFTTTDPVIEKGEPQQWNAYSYANNAPATESDPAGTDYCYNFGSDGRHCRKDAPKGPSGGASPPDNKTSSAGQKARDNYEAAHGLDKASLEKAYSLKNESMWQVFIGAAGEVVKSLIGWDDIQACVTEGNIGSCAMTVATLIPWGKVLKAGEIIESFWKGARALITFGKDVEKAEKVIADSERIMVDAEKAAKEAEDAVAAEERQAASEAEHAAEDAKSSGTSESSEAGTSPGCNSFPAGTLVRLSNGTSKPIDQLQNGDTVLSTDTESGTTQPHAVVGTIVHTDEDQRTQVTTPSGSLTATDWHLVWVDEVGGWVQIRSVVPGEHLHSPDGHEVVVTGVRHFSQANPVYDITVDAVHTFYVLAGSAPVLVHNCNVASGDHLQPTPAEAQEIVQNAPRGSTAAVKLDPYHRAAAWMQDQIAEHGTVWREVGRDRRKPFNALHVTVPGEVNDRAGVFHWIVDYTGTLVHEAFELRK
ncbi:RHS repeat-associated core domain-containing protein [Amycolatopsis stemonae]